MHARELEHDKAIQKWLRNSNFQPHTIESYLTGMQHYTDFTDKTPEQLIQEAKADIKAGKLMDERDIFDMIGGFRHYLQEKKLGQGTMNTYMAGVKSFYATYFIDLPKIKNRRRALRLKENTKVPDKEAIRKALAVCGLREKAIILCGLSSGMGAAEISSLKLQTFKDGYDPETGITTLDMRRVKVQRDYITFLTPEATNAVLAYLEHRDRPTRTGRQVDKDIQAKHRTTPDSYLFITDHAPQEYLKTRDEELRRVKSDALFKLYRRISDNSGQDSASGVYNLIRSHNMRKWFSSTLRKAGCDADLIELFMGHTLGGTKDAYIDLRIDDGIKDVRDMYAEYVPYLTIQKELDVAASPEFKKIESENKVLVAETVKHIVEREEMAEMKRELEQIKYREANKDLAILAGDMVYRVYEKEIHALGIKYAKECQVITEYFPVKFVPGKGFFDETNGQTQYMQAYSFVPEIKEQITAWTMKLLDDMEGRKGGDFVSVIRGQMNKLSKEINSE